MAISKSWSGDVGTAPRRKIFTLAEAQRALPLVRRIVEDVTKAHVEATQLHMQLEDRLPVTQRDEIHNKLERMVDRLGDLIDELKAVGCELKDYRTGLVDFFGRHEGRDICLCWKLGEPEVAHWHELHAGFAGRQPVSTLED